MSKPGYGYGSEYHLLRYLGYHRGALKKWVDEATGGELINWLDFPFSASPQRFFHTAWHGIGFLRDNEHYAGVHEAWRSYWPQTGTAPSWDAVGIMNKGGRTSWILVEAKAQLDELSSECAVRSRARPIIERALATTRESLEISPEHDWLAPHYQFCNRVAILDFLLSHGVTAEVLFIYFTGDNVPRNASIVCPQTVEEWQPSLAAVHEKVGWPGNGLLESHVHELFVPMHNLEVPAAASIQE
jgi:hypothetical protein